MVENQKPAVHKPVAWKKNLRMYNLIKLRENLLNLSAITVDLLTLIWIVLVRPQIQLVTRVAYLVISLECVERKNASFSKPQIAQESPRQREQPNKEPFKSESMRNKRRNRVRAVNKHLDSSTETSSEEDYVYTVENKSDPKTRAKIRVNSVEINFIVDTGATVDVIDSKTYDRLKSSVKLCKSTTYIFAYGSTKPLPLKGEFQATVESNKRCTVSVIHVVEGGSGNLLSAKTAQDLALIQLVNKVTELETPPKSEVSRPETQPILPGNTENTDKQQPMPHASTPKCEDQEIQKIIDKYATVFVGEGKLNTQQVGLHINENIKPVVQPQRRIHTIYAMTYQRRYRNWLWKI